MLRDIKKNKIKTGLIVSIFIVLITLIVYYVCYAFELGPISIVIALVVSIISAWSSYYFSDKIVLSMNKARPATEYEDKKLVDILDSLMLSSGLPAKPKLYVMDSPQPNAFATGRNPENSVICVTTGLLNKLEYYELEGVVAHEMAHIKNYDIRLSAVLSVMVGLVVMLSDLCTRFIFFSNSDRDNKGNPIILIVGLICLILAPIFSSIIQLAVSRRREYLADATAVEFTRNPQGLIDALTKISSDTSRLGVESSSTAHMYIANPFKKGAKAKRKSTSWFSTHPSTEDRINALRNIQ